MNYKFIFARYNESIDWIYDHPFIANHSIIYNKGETLLPKEGFKTEICNISNEPKYGRESDTYLYHIINNFNLLNDYLFFSQADPFDHCPEFISIVKYIIDKKIYKNYQPLSCGWKISERVPPVENVLYDTREYINGYKLYMETVDQRLYPIGYTDHGILPTLQQFRSKHGINNSYDTLKFIYSILKLNTPYCGLLKFNYGGIFGVNKQQIIKNTIDYYTFLRMFVHQDWSHGFILERLWYTIFSK